MVGEQRAEVTVAKARWLLEQLNPLANMPVAEIRPAEVLGALRRIEAKGKYETARRCRAFASRVFRYAVATCRAEHDPSAVLRGALITPKVTHHSALTDPKSIGELLRAIDEYPGSMITRIAMQIMPHVMCRPGELRQAEWREFDFDAAIWTIPPGRVAGDDTSLTAHVVLSADADHDAARTMVGERLEADFAIRHSTIQTELKACEDAHVLHP